MESSIQSNEERRCLICNKPYNYHYDLFGRGYLTMMGIKILMKLY